MNFLAVPRYERSEFYVDGPARFELAPSAIKQKVLINKIPLKNNKSITFHVTPDSRSTAKLRTMLNITRLF
ncbi:MAG: hypothetical protein US57_C0015G0010 [Candidatus Moranbacteria bacterium GW2011_GWC2_37_73]|nr:MAG: hypothetical protein UR95_C0006G0011 [Parcubacteria group bacterium GW2011_GWC1_36_108]KKP99995.1 MAG: hypothetical protein US09_C0026G0040 [Candidatus Moranbacteria bacterium GW2011_GWD1_36_198]KKQ00262.1 MAG: hypothetical protein US10_C0037G0017 [Candidatus Moranbacteria bacterium GW2011_GWD2_36_198]KKQ39320.1 MAG: hypothetical protein US57_C0015G0010 [Candidatus Moranbacteria bacterium GW2011_GWC2_37_73]